jgi:6,7-dimethyl-8-ribityllumazine synthase
VNLDYDALIALGAIIRGETYHFEVVSNEISKAVMQLNLEGKVPISFGVVTADTLEQAINRAGAKMGNKGFEAAMVALEMANINRKINSIKST